MIMALRIIYIIGGMLFYYYKTKLEYDLVAKIADDDDPILGSQTVGEWKRMVTGTVYKVGVIIAAVIWPIMLVTHFSCILIATIKVLITKD